MGKEFLYNESEIVAIIKDKYDIGDIKEINAGASSECFYIATGDFEYVFKNIEMNFMNYPDQEPLIKSVKIKGDWRIQHESGFSF
ncbi:hypothetical protein [Clostridium sp. DJ247]|uniref:hypothetical protein n=1 Tax=Clostridium sp. DJ247 TaxID=2726188 RepID=UPI001626F41B|nr:hypothetical protein [Clostridium sp. DJ247]MBC2582439.1 hypothetical protein [Clostridium sp. DJ247]